MAKIRLDHSGNDKPCASCPLNGTARLRAWTEIEKSSESTPLVVLGSFPSHEENKVGRPFIGKAGQQVKDVLDDTDLTPEDVAFAYAVKCHPGKDGKKTKPIPAEAITQCAKYLRKELKALNPNTVLAMGATAMEALELNSDSIAKGRAQVFEKIPHPKAWSKKKQKKLAAKGKDTNRTLSVVPTYTPEYIVRNPSYRTVLRDDVKNKAARLVDNKGRYLSTRGDKPDIELVTDVKDIRDLVDFLMFDCKKSDYLSFDFETDNVSWHHKVNKPLTVGFALTGDESIGYAVPLQHPGSELLGEDYQTVRKLMRKLFRSKGAKFRGWIAHNAAFEEMICKGFFGTWLGVRGNKPIIDTMIMVHNFDENRKYLPIQYPYSLETLTSEMLGYVYDENLKAERDHLSSIDVERVMGYNAEDAVVTARLFNEILERSRLEHTPLMKDDRTGKTYRETYDKTLLRMSKKLYSRTIRYGCTMKRNGQKVDIEQLQRLRQDDSPISGRLRQIRRKFKKSKYVKRVEKQLQENTFGGNMDAMFLEEGEELEGSFTITKPDHVRSLFFDVMGLEPTKKSDSGTPSVDKSFQEEYAASVPLVGLYQEFQSLNKLESAYLSPIGEKLQTRECSDGRVHPTFHLTRTVTGRASASDPNTQQMPRSDSPAKKAIKCLFMAPEDHAIIQLDYSQAEVRWLGIISGDKSLAERYAVAEELKEEYIRNPTEETQRRIISEGDIHMVTALSMFGLPSDLPFTDPTKAKNARQAAKSICFGLIYGKHYKTLARDLGLEELEAKDMVDKWMGQFPQAAQWLEDIERFVAEHGYVQSPLGRRRRLPEVFSDNGYEASRARRQARNSPIQGAASDTNFYAAGKLMEEIETNPALEGVRLTNTVHDSVISEVPMDKIMEYCKISKAIFTDQDLLLKDFGVKLTVPLAVDFEVGPNWGSLLDFDLTKKNLREIKHDLEVMRGYPGGTTYKELEKKGLLYASKKKKKKKKKAV